MVSVAVLFVVGTLALGAYKDYVYKAHASEVFTHITGVKILFHERYAAKNLFPGSEEIRSYLANTDNISLESYEAFADESNGIAGAAITVSISSDLQEINGDTVTFTALQDKSKGVLLWSCGYARYQDYPFANAYNKTTLKREYLPEICRD
jgi:Tfp pilus assembly protein PilE